MHDAVREALVNCLANADFFLPRGIVIDSYPDRIVIKNPGTSIVGKRQMLRGGESEPRNTNIMKMFNLLGFGEHAGSGIPDIYSVWASSGYMEPTIEEHFGEDGPSKTVITLPLIEKVSDHHQDHHQGDKEGDDLGANHSIEWDARKAAIIDLLTQNPELSIDRLSEALYLTRRQTERSINYLKEEGRISREGSTRSGRWVVNKEHQ